MARARRASQKTRDMIKGSGQHPVVKEEPEPTKKSEPEPKKQAPPKKDSR